MKYRIGFVGLIGLPNAGKSTLVNAIIGEKVSIVTAKPQTTRQKVLGIYGNESSQMIFVDAPGIIQGESGLNLFLKNECESVASESDVLVTVLNLDANKMETLLKVAHWVKEKNKPWVIVVTKTDIGKYQRIDLLKGALQEFQVPVIEVSALSDPGDAARKILPMLESMLPETDELLYDSDLYTTQSLKEMCGEIIREKCFEVLHQEIPYGLAVKIQKFDETQGSAVKIYGDIIINKDGHKPIVVGRGGAQLKGIGTQARLEIEKLLGRKVYLELHVIVKKNWIKNPSMLEELGYGNH